MVLVILEDQIAGLLFYFLIECTSTYPFKRGCRRRAFGNILKV